MDKYASVKRGRQEICCKAPLLPIAAVCTLFLASCAMQIHAPTVSHEPAMQDEPWLVRCETARVHDDAPGNVTGASNLEWVFAEDERGHRIEIDGKLVDGFLEVTAMHSSSGQPIEASRMKTREACLDSISRIEGSEQLMLGWVMAARAREEINIPPVYPEEMTSGDKVTRMVIFGDSLTDTGRLKQRLKIFPLKPYWIGRFSNGPVWPEYLAMATGMGVQNLAYGGASAADQDALPGERLLGRARQVGQFFVSGTIELQISDYLGRTLRDGKIGRADTTAFLIWAGANDYISKEPISGLITTFLSSPEGEAGYKAVVERAVTQLGQHVRTLYAAGARRFVMVNLPDLGRTPIVLQNTTYAPEHLENNDAARKLDLAHRLTELTRYHNQILATAVEQLRMDLPGSEIILVDAFEHFKRLYGADDRAPLQPADYGYEPTALAGTLSYEGQRLTLQQRCYSGFYNPVTLDPNSICPNPDQALFWDSVHPTTLTHCWQAWNVGNDLAEAGWIRPLPDQRAYLAWCQTIVNRVTLGSAEDLPPVHAAPH
jgi:phospholipase/lecithinase/hemolysin